MAKPHQCEMENDIDLISYWNIVLKWKKSIMAIVFSMTLLAIIICLCLPRIYRAQVTIMPQGGDKAAGGVMAALGGILGGSLGTPSSSTNQILAILKSRTLAEKVITKYDLMKVLFPKQGEVSDSQSKKPPSMERAVIKLFSMIKSNEDKKSQLIDIRVEMQDPKAATELANNYIKELSIALNENIFSDAKRHRIFIEGQLERNQADFLRLGKELSVFYTKNRISNVQPTVDVDVTAELKNTDSNVTLPLSLQDQRVSESDQAIGIGAENLADVKQKTEDLQNQLGKIEAQIKGPMVVEAVPQQVYLQYLEHRRRLLGQVNALLMQQYEMAKVEESRDDLNFQVIDWARVPEQAVKPERRRIVMVAFILSFGFAVFYAFFREYLESLKARRA